MPDQESPWLLNDEQYLEKKVNQLKLLDIVSPNQLHQILIAYLSQQNQELEIPVSNANAIFSERGR